MTDTPTPSATPESTVAAITGLRGGLLLLVVIGGGVALAGLTAFFFFLDPPFNLEVGIVEFGVMLPILVLMGLLAWGSSVTRLELTDSKVVFHKPLNALSVSWEWMVPPQHRYGLGEIAMPFHPRGEPGSESWVFLSRAQMMALLAHPKCPKWDLDPAVRSSLGLSSAGHP